MAQPLQTHMQYPSAPHIQPQQQNGPSKLWVLQAGFNTPTTPGQSLGITNDFAHPSAPKTPKTPRTPKGVAVPSRDSNLTELGYPNWAAIYEGLIRKIADVSYGYYHGTTSDADGAGALNAQAAADILQSTIGGHLPAFKAFLTHSLRAAPSTLPASPNPASITAPIPALSQQILLGQLSAFLSSSLLSHQLQQLVAVMTGQVHFVLGEVLRGAGFPVETHVLGHEQANGAGCGLRLMDNLFQARIYLFRTAMAAQATQARQRQLPVPSPIFYLTPSHAHSLGFPDTLPRFCWELNLTPAAFKVMPLTPTVDEALLSQIARLTGQLDAAVDDDGRPPAEGDVPNPFLSYQLDAHSLELEIEADMVTMRTQGSGAPQPCAVFASVGNHAGLDLPYECDNVEELARITAKFSISLHAEGASLFAEDPKLAQANGHGPTHSTSTLFESVDSVLVQPGTWLGLQNTTALLAFRDPRFLSEPLASQCAANGFYAGVEATAALSPSMLSLSTSVSDEFASLFALWFNLLQVNPASFQSLLARLHARQCEKVQTLKRLVHAHPCPSFVAPAGELEDERKHYTHQLAQGGLTQWLPATPSHAHFFFYLSLPAPLRPRDFNLSVAQFNSYLSNKLSQRLASKQGEYAVWGRAFGLNLQPVIHFDRVGWLYQPAAVTIWTSESQIADEQAAMVAVLEAITEEVRVLEDTANLRAEFEALLSTEASEFVYVPFDTIDVSVAPAAPASRMIGLGGVRYLPSQVPEVHVEEVGALFNNALAQLPAAMHMLTPVDADPFNPAPVPMITGSVYRSGRTLAEPDVPSNVCTIVDLSEAVLRRGLREIVAELKATAGKLVFPAHIVEDLNETLRQGIKAAEEALVIKSVDAYRPTAVLRWLPVVGSVLNWVAPPAPENGQQFDMKRRELSSIKYSYSNATSGAVAAAPSLSRKGSNSSLLGSAPATPRLPTPLSTAAMTHATPPVTPSPLSINQTAQAHQLAANSATPTSVSSASPASLQKPITSAVPPPQQTIAASPATNGAAAPANRPPLPPNAHAPPVTINQQPPPQLLTSVQQQQQLLQQQQAAQVAAAPAAAASSTASHTIPPVKITLDEADSAFVADLNAAPRTLQQDQLQLLCRGQTFLAYFPNEPDDVSADPASVPPTSVTKLFLFLEPNYLPSAEEAVELGVAYGHPVSLLCWCEPAGPRYVKSDQSVAIEQVSSLHLGAGDVFPRQSIRANCFSLITQHVALHLEADSPHNRKAFFLALYSLVTATPAQMPAHLASVQHPAQSQALARVSPSSASSAASESSDERALASARQVLEVGQPFTVFVLDKNDIELTTTHSVILWLRPAVGAAPHSLCWCRRGGSLDYSPSRSLPLNKTIQVCLGRQTKAFRNAAAQNTDPDAAFSIMVEKMILNLEATSAADRTSWLSAFHNVMSASGKKQVFDESQEQATPQLQ